MGNKMVKACCHLVLFFLCGCNESGPAERFVIAKNDAVFQIKAGTVMHRSIPE
ncbi:hypothetical protein [Vibrio aerogenes]|uniref:hypothetical protein n=1 Tax=Vibrio aerogenes TaxID=92172 RepID=UPI0015882627|nr:hypothetical protein [Vibrio aerogenes]